MRVLLYDQQELRQSRDLRYWFVAVPLGVGPLPVDSPDALRPHVCCESPRVLRRLNTLRGLSHEEDKQVLA